MSVTNAISGIILVGGMLQLSGELNVTTILGAVAVLIATINTVGGFMVTNRMLAMLENENQLITIAYSPRVRWFILSLGAV